MQLLILFTQNILYSHIYRTPFKYSPSLNPVVFGLSGSSDTVYFKVKVIESTQNTVIYTGNVYPTPRNPQSGLFNVSRVIDSIVRPEIDNTSDIAISKTSPITSFKIVCNEYYVSGSEILSGSTVSSSVYTVWNADLDSMNYTYNFNSVSHVMRTGSSNVKFLTSQPSEKYVNDYSTEQLYFLQDSTTAFNLNVSISGSNYSFPITSSTSTLVSAGSPAKYATASITITGTGSAGDNIGVYVNNVFLGSYTASNSVSSTAIAGNLYGAIALGSSGYVSNLYGTKIEIYATASGVGGNSLQLATRLLNSASGVTPQPYIPASASVYSLYVPDFSETVYVSAIHPVNGYVPLAEYSYSTGMDNLTTLTNGIINLINASASVHQFSASYVTAGEFTVFNNDVGSAMNGQTLNVFHNTFFGFFDFQGGQNLISGSIAYHSMFPHTTSSFANGVDVVQAVYSNELAKMYRLQVSPKKLALNGVTGFANGQYYTVSIKSGSTVLSETRKYIYEETECNTDYVNILFTNSLGGVDSYQFIAPVSSVNSKRLSMIKNNVNLDSSTPFITDNVFNSSDVVYSNVSKTKITLWTKPLSDNEAKWIVELINSKSWYLELNNGALIPVILSNSDYVVSQRKYLKTSLNQFQFEFQLPDNFLPDLTTIDYIIN